MGPYSLISIGQLCDAGCTAIFNKRNATVYFRNTPILTGTRTPPGLWTINGTPSQQPVAALAHRTTKRLSDLMTFLHAACFSPVTQTLLKAIDNGHFLTWPGFNRKNVVKHLTKSVATTLGHLDQQRQGVASTKTQPTKSDDDFHPTALGDSTSRHNALLVAIQPIQPPSGRLYTDQTGRFPHTSFNGNQYVMVAYDYDSNAILVRPLRNRTGSHLLATMRNIYEFLAQRGLQPSLHILDNEASHDLKKFITSKNTAYQLAPPHTHRRNAAERAIRTWKNHFLAGLASTDAHFPIQLWDHLLPQSEITLNLLRASRLNPRLSAYAQLNGQFDYNATPLAPPGIQVVAYETPQKRNSWALHGFRGWYVGPAMEHYRCYQIYDVATHGIKIRDTVEFFPTRLHMPQQSSLDAAHDAAIQLTHALQHPQPSTPFPQMGNKDIQALTQLAEIFQRNTTPTGSQPTRVKPAATAFNAWADKIPPQTTPNATLTEVLEQHYAKPWPHVPFSNAFAGAVHDAITGKHLEYRDLITLPHTKDVWLKSAANEFGRLAQGVGNRIQGTNTIDFIPINEVPKGHKPTYARFVCTMRPQKKEVERTRITVGGNLIDYPYQTHTPTADLTTFKLLVNSTLSTPNAKMCMIDVKNFYLNTPMPHPEYMSIPIDLIPPEIIAEYKLEDIVHNGRVYVRINKGMYGLPQAGRLANDLLAKRLGKHGYYQCRHTPGLWKHVSRPTIFALIVDDFAVKYIGKEHADHLIAILNRDYEAISVDWSASLFAGIHLKWDYNNRTCELSMPGYIAATLQKFDHPNPNRPQHAPHRYNAPVFGSTH